MKQDKRATGREISDRASDPICPNCGADVVRKSSKGPPPDFCSTKCRKEFWNRANSEGRALVSFVKAWRISWGKGPIGKAAMSEMSSIADQLNEADRLAGRPPADLHAAKMLDSGTLYMDRKKR